MTELNEMTATEKELEGYEALEMAVCNLTTAKLRLQHRDSNIYNLEPARRIVGDALRNLYSQLRAEGKKL